MKKKFLAFILAAIMVVSLLPVAAFATEPIKITMHTPDLGGKVVNAKYYTINGDAGTHIPSLDFNIICNGEDIDIISCSGGNDGSYNGAYWRSMCGNTGGYQANILFSTSDPTVKINEQWSYITEGREFNFEENTSTLSTSKVVVDAGITGEFDFSVKGIMTQKDEISFSEFAADKDVDVPLYKYTGSGDSKVYDDSTKTFTKTKASDELGIDDAVFDKLEIVSYAKYYYYKNNTPYNFADVTASVDKENKTITLSGDASDLGASQNAWLNNNLYVAYPTTEPQTYEFKGAKSGAQYNIFMGDQVLTKKDFDLPTGIFVYREDIKNTDGEVISRVYHLTSNAYVLNSLTLKSKYDTLYKDSSTDAEDIVALLSDEDSLDVWAYYSANENLVLDANVAENGGYDDEENWELFKLSQASDPSSTEGKYILTLTDYDSTDSAGPVTDNTKHVLIKAAFTDSDVTKDASVVINIEDIATSDSYVAKDGSGNKITAGVAAKFNDASGFVKYGENQNLYATVSQSHKYVNDVYKYENSTAALSLGAFTNTDNKTYTVQYTPYNAYGEVTDSAQYILGNGTTFYPYDEETSDDTINTLKEVAFRDAGLYAVTERTTRKDDKTFDRTFYIVIEQADLQITQATDTVHENTKVQNHRFTRFVEGVNGEQVFGTFTFAQSDGNAAWGNGEDRTVNGATSIQDNIAWEFNIYDGTYGTANSDGKKNLNNYLDQSDGASAEATGDAQNSYYKGTNGVLTYAQEGEINTRVADMTVTVKAVEEQQESATAKQTEADAFTSTSITTTDQAQKTVTGVYAEDIEFSGTIDTTNLGWRVVVGDAVTGDIDSGDKVESEADLPAAYQAYYSSLIDGAHKYKGDLYIITVKAGNTVVETIQYTDTTAKNEIHNIASKLARRVTDKLPACEYYGVDAYTVTVDYIGLYYTTETSTDGRESGWSGEEEFNWVTSKVSFALDVEQRDVVLNADVLNDLDKIYDGTAYLVKQTTTSGDVTAASKYIIDLEETNAGTAQFAKRASALLLNYVDPTGGAQDHMAIELAGTYASANKGANQNVAITAKRLLHFQNIAGKGTKIPAAGDQVAALNYNIKNVSGTAKGKIDIATLHFTHNRYGTVNVYDNTPMHEVLGISAKAYLLTMEDGVNGAEADGFYDVLTMNYAELTEKDDAKTSAATFNVNSTKFDYDVTYSIDTTPAYGPFFEGSTLAIDDATGAVTSVATGSLGGTNPTNYPAIKVNVANYGNFTLSPDSTHSDVSIYNNCVKTGANNISSNGETCAHTMRFKITGNGNNYDLLLPVDQLNNRAVTEPATAYTPSKFINRTGGTVATAATDGENYNYIAVYPNGDSAQFEFTVPQDSYLEDVKIVAVKNADETAYKTYSNATKAVPAFATLLADTTNVIGTFTAQATATTGMNNIANPLFLTLDEVNDVAVASAAYFGGSKAESAKGYTATQLADANEQIGGSTYTFTLTTGACNLGENYAIAVVPVIKAYSPIIEKSANDTDGLYKSNLSVEKTITSATDSTLTFTDAADDSIYVNYKTLWDTTAGVSGQFGTINMSYTATDSDINLPEQILSANFKDQFNSFAINTESTDPDYTTFFDPAKLIPGTEVSVTIKLWRNGVTANLQNVSVAANDNDAMDTVTFTWTVSEDDYYRLFKDDVVVLRSSNAMEADTALATAQKTDNIIGYIINPSNATNFTNAKVIMKDATADTAVTALLKSADEYEYTENPYTYTMPRAVNGSTLTYAATGATPEQMLGDIARFLGAMYRGGNAESIVYGDTEYTWDAAGTLKGSNWKDADENTLVSVIVAQAASLGDKLTLKVDGTDVVFQKASAISDDGKWSVRTGYDILANLADTWYKCDTTEARRTIDTTAKTMSDLTAGDNLYPTYEVVTLYASDFTGGTSHTVIGTGTGTEARTPSVVGYAHLIGGELDLDSAFASKTLADVNGIKTTADYPAADKLVDLTKYAVPYTVYGWYSEDACSDEKAVTAAVTTTAGKADLYAKVAVNTVKLTDGTSTIGYAAYNAKAGNPITIDFTKADFASAAPVQGTKYVTAAKDLKNYDKPSYTGETWYTDASFTTPVVYSGDPAVNVAVTPDTEFFLKSTYSGGGGGGGAGVTSYDITAASATHGKISLDKDSAAKGELVTITVTPDKGMTLETITVKDAKGKEVALTTVKAGETYTFKMPAGKVTIAATFMEDNTMLNFFIDVKAEDYFYDAVLWAAENGITKGVDDTHFGPDLGTTRGQVVTFLWRAAGSPEPTGDASKFVDLKAGEYYEKAIAWAIDQGITKGTSDTTFSPDVICTRGQIVTFLARFAGVEDADTASVFSDVQTTDYYAAAVKWAKDNGVTDGTSATTFSPSNDCTRGQIVTFLYRWMV